MCPDILEMAFSAEALLAELDKYQKDTKTMR
jgi:hypothetical protein